MLTCFFHRSDVLLTQMILCRSLTTATEYSNATPAIKICNSFSFDFSHPNRYDFHLHSDLVTDSRTEPRGQTHGPNHKWKSVLQRYALNRSFVQKKSFLKETSSEYIYEYFGNVFVRSPKFASFLSWFLT